MESNSFLKMSPMVERAYEIAAKAHEGATDKAGAPYIMHPVTVASTVVGYGEKYVATALMHDVIEDTDTELSDLEGLFPEDVIEALSLLTHAPVKGSYNVYHKSYMEYVHRIKDSGNDIAIKVKLADLCNNMDISRIPNPTDWDRKRIEVKYKPAMEILLGE